MPDNHEEHSEELDISETELIRLVKGAKKGSQDDFTRICNLKQRKLFFYCLNILGNHHDAEDASQETILQMWKSIGDLKNPEAFDAWMLTVARSKCIYILSKQKRADTLSIDSDEGYLENTLEMEDLDREVLPEKYAEDSELAETLYRVITELPVKRREALIMYYYNGLSTTEIAKITKSTPNVVTGVITKARLQLKKKLLEIEGSLFIMGIAPQSVIGKALSEASFNHVSDGQLLHLEGLWHSAIVGVTPYVLILKSYIKAFSATAAGVVLVFTGVAIGANTSTDLYASETPPPPTSVPAVTQPAVPAESAETEGEISFTGDCECGHKNPRSAVLTGNPADDSAVTYNIAERKSHAILASGNGKDASVDVASMRGNLGDYTVIFTVTGEDGSRAEFSRDFSVED
jgi:RNA polymerase sigma-70 factor (ECF subfamily)